MVRRIYVEKKKGFDVEAAGLLADLQQNLHVAGLTGVRVFTRYDVAGIDDETYERARYTVFAEPAIDTAYDEEMPADVAATYFATEYLPGQYDQRADSAAQCIKLMNVEADATVKGKTYCYKMRSYDVQKNGKKKFSGYGTIKTIKR